MVILWPDIESGRDLVKLNLDCLPRPSNFDYTFQPQPSHFDYKCQSMGHIDLILDAPTSNLAKSSSDLMLGCLKSIIDGYLRSNLGIIQV